MNDDAEGNVLPSIRDNDSAKATDSFVGRLFQKYFHGHGMCQGKIVSLDQAVQPALYTVRFEDGEDEQFTQEEVLQHLQPLAEEQGDFHEQAA